MNERAGKTPFTAFPERPERASIAERTIFGEGVLKEVNRRLRGINVTDEQRIELGQAKAQAERDRDPQAWLRAAREIEDVFIRDSYGTREKMGSFEAGWLRMQRTLGQLKTFLREPEKRDFDRLAKESEDAYKEFVFAGTCLKSKDTRRAIIRAFWAHKHKETAMRIWMRLNGACKRYKNYNETIWPLLRRMDDIVHGLDPESMLGDGIDEIP